MINSQFFDIDNHAVKNFTDDLRKMKNKSFPWVVRNTLNDLALDVKQRTMPKHAQQEFTNRTKTFFKSQSSVNYAKGNNINMMRSEIGFTNWKTKTDAVSNLEQQEHGGVIDDRDFLPMNQARISNSLNRMVRGKNRIEGIRKTKKMASKAAIYDAQSTNLFANSFGRSRRNPNTTKSQRVLIAAINSKKGGYFRTDNSLFYVDSLTEVKKNRKYKFRITKVYSYKKGRSVRIKNATHFMEKSTIDTMKIADNIYIAHAEHKLRNNFRS